MQRAQDLIKASFHGINKDFTGPLQDCLKAVQQAPPAAPGGYYASQWPEQAELGALSSQLGAVSRHAGAHSRSYRLRKRPRHDRVSKNHNFLVWHHCMSSRRFAVFDIISSHGNLLKAVDIGLCLKRFEGHMKAAHWCAALQYSILSGHTVMSIRISVLHCNQCAHANTRQTQMAAAGVWKDGGVFWKG